MKLTAWMAIGLASAIFGLGAVRAADATNKPAAAPERIGVYDSRAIGYAHFWTETQQSKLNEMAKTAKAARAAGQTERYKELSASLKKARELSHLQVFSIAPVTNVLAEMKDLPAVQKEAGVSQLVSKWDDQTLKEHARAELVDVTDLLLRGFTLNEKQQKVVADLRTKKPLPLKEAEKLMREGKL